MLLNTGSCARCTVTPNNTEILELEQKRGFLQGHMKRLVACAQRTQNCLKGFSKALLKARWGREVVSCCKLLGVGILCSHSCLHRSGQDVPVNVQQDKCYFLFCNFLSLYEWRSVILLKVRALRKGLSCIFQATGNIILQKVQSQHE